MIGAAIRVSRRALARNQVQTKQLRACLIADRHLDGVTVPKLRAVVA